MSRQRFSKSFLFVLTLLFFTACERDAHEYINFVNHSHIPVWVHIDSYSDDPKEHGPIRTDDYVEADEALQIGTRSGFAWEKRLYSGMKLLVCIYDESLSGKPDDESYKEFAQKHLLEEKWYTIEELNELNWEINYYPEEKGVHREASF